MVAAETLSLISSIVTIIGLPVAIAALFAVSRQMKNERLAVSAGALGVMRTGMMERVDRLRRASIDDNVEDWEFEARELFNDLEMASAVFLDGQISGRTGKLAHQMICDFLDIVNNDSDLREELEKAVHAPDTFINIMHFRAEARKHA